MVYRSTYVYPFLFYAFRLPKFPPDHRWNSYLRAIDNYVEKMVGLLCCTREYLAPFDMYLYKCQLRPIRNYWCYIWTGVAQSWLSSFVDFQIVYTVREDLFSNLQSFSLRLSVTSLSIFPWPMFRWSELFSSIWLDI